MLPEVNLPDNKEIVDQTLICWVSMIAFLEKKYLIVYDFNVTSLSGAEPPTTTHAHSETHTHISVSQALITIKQPHTTISTFSVPVLFGG